MSKILYKPTIVAAEPRNWRTAWIVLGTGHVCTLSTFTGSTYIPSFETICPKYCTFCLSRAHFDGLSVKAACLILLNTLVNSVDAQRNSSPKQLHDQDKPNTVTTAALPAQGL